MWPKKPPTVEKCESAWYIFPKAARGAVELVKKENKMKKKTFIAALFCCLVPLLSGAAGAPAPDPLLKLQGSASATLKVFDLPGSIVAAIEDQPGRMPAALFRSIDPNKKVRLPNSFPSSINVFLVKNKKNGKLFLIDAGFGRPSSRLLPDLKAAGIPPGMISGILITHIHPDHVGGLTRPDGKAAFPKAKVFIARKEFEAWKSDPNRAGLAKHLAPCKNDLVLFDFDREIPGTGLVPLLYPGHTPGHTVFELQTGPKGERVTFAGDIVHAADLQIKAYDFCARFDMEPRTAAGSRKKLLERGGCWFGAHIPFPGRARIVRRTTDSGIAYFSYTSE